VTIVKTSLRNFFAHKWRMILSGLAVVLSVSFVCGTLVFTATMNTTFDRLFEVTASNVMVTAESEDGGSMDPSGGGTGVPDTVPASVLHDIENVEGVEGVIGVVYSLSVTAVDDQNENVGPTTGAPTIVANWSPVEARSMEIIEGEAPTGPSEVMVDSDTARNKDVALGDEIRLITPFGDFETTVSGIAEFQVTNPGAAMIYTDLPTAQDYLLGGKDEYTEVHVNSAGGITDEQLKENVSEAIGAGSYNIQTAEEYTEENQDELGEILSILEWVLLGFAGIALVVGIFLIVNTFSMLVAQRTRELGLMRAVGATRRQVNRTVLIEALLLGVIGSVIGFGLGVAIAIGLMQLMNAIGMTLSTDDLTIEPAVPVTGIILGVLVTLIAAYVPARRAGRISPMAALRDAGMPGDVRAGRLRALIGAVLTVAGLAALAGTARVDEATAGVLPLALGVLLSLVGLILLGPALVGLVVRALSAVLLRGFGPVGRMAERNALRNPRRTGATASALMIGLALVAGLSVVGSSMVASATEEIDETLGADYVISTSNFTPINQDVIDLIEGTEAIEHVTAVRGVHADVTLPDGETFERYLNVAEGTYAEDIAAQVAEGDLADAFAPGAIALDENTAEDHGIGLGDTITVDFPRGETADLTVAVITSSDSAVEGAAWYVGTETLRSTTPEEEMPLPMTLFASAVDGQEEQAAAQLDRALEPYPQIEVRDQAEFKELIQDQVGGLLNMVYGLLALAIIVAVLGVVNTLALSVVERTREIGLLRAIGLSRRQLRRVIRLESVVIALFGALLGLGLGLAWGVTAQQVLEGTGFHVLEIPWATVGAVFAGSVVVGLLAALVPAFRAGRMNVLAAIATD
jgi:putative ABC transport system permease protein